MNVIRRLLTVRHINHIIISTKSMSVYWNGHNKQLAGPSISIWHSNIAVTNVQTNQTFMSYGQTKAWNLSKFNRQERKQSILWITTINVNQCQNDVQLFEMEIQCNIHFIWGQLNMDTLATEIPNTCVRCVRMEPHLKIYCSLKINILIMLKGSNKFSCMNAECW